MEQVFVVTEYYTPYKHNGLTEENEVTLFSNFRKALSYARGTDSSGVVERPDRVGIALRQGCEPQYKIDTYHKDGITLLVQEECVDEIALQQGGWVYKVTIEPKHIN